MKLHTVLLSLCVLLAFACLSLGYGLTGRWLIMLALPALAAFWLATHKQSGFWAGSAVLALYIGLAAVGVALGVSAPLMAVGCICALAGWDLSDPRGHATLGAASEQATPLERERLRLLAVMAGLSLALVALTALVQLRLPFGVIALAALVAVGCTLYGVQLVRRAAREHHD